MLINMVQARMYYEILKIFQTRNIPTLQMSVKNLKANELALKQINCQMGDKY